MAAKTCCYEKVGEITFYSKTIEAGDPGIESDYGLTLKIVPGTYECFIKMKNVKNPDGKSCHQRVSRIMIKLKGDTETEKKLGDTYTSRSYRQIGVIPVDAGLAGFFQNRPGYYDEKKYEKCIINTMYPEIKTNPSKTNHWAQYAIGNECGFFSNTGFGDGCYPVYAIRNEKRKITACEIRFLDE